MKRGEIWLVDFGEIDKTSSVQLGERPAIIVSNDVANKYSPVITVIPLSTNMKKAKLQTRAESPLLQVWEYQNINHILSVEKKWL